MNGFVNVLVGGFLGGVAIVAIYLGLTTLLQRLLERLREGQKR